MGDSLQLALLSVKDKTPKTGYKIEFTRPGSPGRRNWEPMFTVIKYARSIEDLRDPVALRAAYVKRFPCPRRVWLWLAASPRSCTANWGIAPPAWRLSRVPTR